MDEPKIDYPMIKSDIVRVIPIEYKKKTSNNYQLVKGKN